LTKNIVHFSTSDLGGGSARSAYRIHRNLLKIGFNSKMLVKVKLSSDSDVQEINNAWWLKKIDSTLEKILSTLGFQYLCYPSNFFIFFNKWYKDADIIILYNTHGGYFSHILLRFFKKKKIFWRLSDMWPITGHCTYSYNCSRWREDECRNCPDLSIYPSLKWDSAHLNYLIKKNVLKNTDITFIAPSSWTFDLIEKSPISQHLKKSLIPNGIDQSIFYKRNKLEIEKKLKIHTSKIIITFASVDLNDARKGSIYLYNALSDLDLTEKIAIVLFGRGDSAEKFKNLGYEVYDQGFLDIDEKIADIFSITDIYIHLAIAENLPNTIIESMMCGAPTLAFNVGGVGDVVKHNETGILCEVENVAELKRSLNLIVNDKEELQRLSNNALIFIQKFSQENEVNKLIKLLEEG
jgi:glycosyltransferase involved in cell wall biosynthesis